MAPHKSSTKTLKDNPQDMYLAGFGQLGFSGIQSLHAGLNVTNSRSKSVEESKKSN
jgi:hypothetical protein